jgi:hypothetical protein
LLRRVQKSSTGTAESRVIQKIVYADTETISIAKEVLYLLVLVAYKHSEVDDAVSL